MPDCLPLDDELRAVFDASPLVAALPAPEREALAARTGVCRLAAGETLFRQGDAGEHVYLLARGEIKLSQLTADGQQVIVAVLGAGDLFAAAVAFQTTRYPVSAEATSACRLLAWPRDLIAGLMARYPALSLEATRVISERMWQLQERYRDLATLSVPARLARQLGRLAERHGRRRPDGAVELTVRLTRQDLAELAGTTLYTVSRLLSSWQEKGLVEVGRRRVAVVDPEGLAAVAAE